MAQAKQMMLSVESMDAYMSLFGLNDQNMALIEQECNVTVALRGNELIISGEAEDVELASSVLEKLLDMLRRHEQMDRARIRYAIALARDGKVDMIDDILKSVVAITHRGKQIRCKTLGQQTYVQTIRDHDLTFAVGPAGTGKTYLAMALAVVALKNKEVERIVLTRPAVEAGEKLGFLPGDLTQKVDPYLRPLYDALYDFMGVDSYQKLVERGVVEVAPFQRLLQRCRIHPGFPYKGPDARFLQKSAHVSRIGARVDELHRPDHLHGKQHPAQCQEHQRAYHPARLQAFPPAAEPRISPQAKGPTTLGRQLFQLRQTFFRNQAGHAPATAPDLQQIHLPLRGKAQELLQVQALHLEAPQKVILHLPVPRLSSRRDSITPPTVAS